MSERFKLKYSKAIKVWYILDTRTEEIHQMSNENSLHSLVDKLNTYDDKAEELEAYRYDNPALKEYGEDQ